MTRYVLNGREVHGWRAAFAVAMGLVVMLLATLFAVVVGSVILFFPGFLTYWATGSVLATVIVNTVWLLLICRVKVERS